jgi:fucose 4-O-acetylase-like acetyltransferase
MGNSAKAKTEVKARDSYWDNIKGVLIILVVFAHVLYSYQDSKWINFIVDSIYMFHMPAFIFVSGYFSTSEKSKTLRAQVRFIKAYVLFNGLFVIYNLISDGSAKLLTPYYSYWYLIALVVWRLSVKFIADKKYAIYLTLIAALLVGFWSDVTNVMAIARIIAFYPFFLAGYLYRDSKINRDGKLRQLSGWRKILPGGGTTALLLILLIASYKLCHFSNGALMMGRYGGLKAPLGRCVIFAVAGIAIVLLLVISIDKKIPFLTKAGKNSLSIYLIHRPVTLVINKLFGEKLSAMHAYELVIVAVIVTCVLVIILGTDFVSKCVEILIGDKSDKYRAIPRAAYGLMALAMALVPAWNFFISSRTVTSTDNDVMYNVLSDELESKIDNALRIEFAGDLILLEDQVKNAYTGAGYDFSDMFEYTEKYISSADLAIGVLEGPLGGEDIGYSTSNFGDGKKLALNFPDEFADAISDAGFDVVTTANNHLLDKGVDASARTLDVLDDIGMSHIGSYRDATEKESSNVLYKEVDGVSFAILAYTYGSNGYSSDELLSDDLSYVTSVLVSPDSDKFDSVKQSVVNDLEKARALNPDFIIVLPHMGTQFEDYPSEYQETWRDVFLENGADIILGDHPHAVQPVVYEEYDGRTTFTAYCPGNYANSYREYNGDASALVEIYIDRESKSIIAGSIVPMWTESSIDGIYRPLPIYDIMNESGSDLQSELSTDDLERAAEVNEHITGVMLGTELGLDTVRERYYFDESGFLREKSETIEVTDEMKEGIFYRLYSSVDSVCFIGDSVTEGTKNGGYPWYEPLESICDVSVTNISKGGATVQSLLDLYGDEIAATKAELYVIAIGTNDVRYRNENKCAMTAEAYTDKIKSMADTILSNNSTAQLVFIAPWTSTDGDTISKLNYQDKVAMNTEYSKALEQFCADNG